MIKQHIIEADIKKKQLYEQATPVMKQYFDIKCEHIDCLLLFRMGDFYELFYEDAIIASKELGIALTHRQKNDKNPIPMCGVPYHALTAYLNKLLQQGFKIAICDQLETPEEAKKRAGYKALVKRSVSRIITPGTIIDEDLLSAGQPNYLVSIFFEKDNNTVCYVDLSTSEIAVNTVPANEIMNEITRIAPKEILCSEKYKSSDLIDKIVQQFGHIIRFQVENSFAYDKCNKIILDFYKIQTCDSIGISTKGQVSSVGSIIEYLSLTQKEHLKTLPYPQIINYHKFMNIDSSARSNLEITNSLNGGVKCSLLGIIDQTITKGGSRLLYRYLSSPSIDINVINERLEKTDFFLKNSKIRESVRSLLKKTSDLDRCVTRLNMKNSAPRDLINIRDTINIASDIRVLFIKFSNNEFPDILQKLINKLTGYHEFSELIDESIRDDVLNNLSDGNIIKKTYHPKIHELYDIIENGKKHIDKLQDKYRKETNIENLKISHNNILGLFIEITSKNVSKIYKEDFIHRQTTVNSVRYTTAELQELEGKMISAKSLAISLEQELYNEICSRITDKYQNLITLASVIAELDVFTNFAYVADEYNYCKPTISNDMNFDIELGRHPVVEQAVGKNNKSFISNNCSLSYEDRVWLITGPNMSGKSTFLRQNAIIAILAHVGSFVPASKAKIGIIDKIFSRIGASDNLSKGQSTFMMEMTETAAILNQSTQKSLIILDEVGRGTSTYDGVSIAWSVLEYIHEKIRARCLFATHYHELTKMSAHFPGIKNYTVSIYENNDQIVFLHNIIEGIVNRSYGIHVAELAGLPKIVINKSKILLNQFENNKRESSECVLQLDEEKNTVNAENANKINIELAQKIMEIDLNELTPKLALDLIYKLHEMIIEQV